MVPPTSPLDQGAGAGGSGGSGDTTGDLKEVAALKAKEEEYKQAQAVAGRSVRAGDLAHMHRIGRELEAMRKAKAA